MSRHPAGLPCQPGGAVYVPPPGGQAYAPPEAKSRGTFGVEEIKDAGHRFFGSVSMGLAEAIEYTFQRAGRPNGYILGEEAGGAIIAGVRYGEGVLYTKDAGNQRLYWQGPSVGYDLGAEGSKTMVLVYDLRSPGEIYDTFARSRRLCLSRRWRWRHIPGPRPRYSCPNPVRSWFAAWRQYRVSEIYPRADLESVLDWR